MTRFKVAWRAALGMGGMILLALACDLLKTPDTVLIDDGTVIVSRGGGSAEVMFHVLAGQQVLITLTARRAGMQPYGQLIGPDGSASDAPPVSAASNGINSAHVTLAQMGTYTLRVFDGARLGGRVTVRVELVLSTPTSTAPASP